IDDLPACARTIESLVTDAALRERLEQKISHGYQPISWASVTQRILDGCAKAAAAQWQEPYPLPLLVHGREVSFACVGVEVDGLYGDELFDRVVRSRKSSFVFNGLDETSLVCGEESRVAGAWGQPEDWGIWALYPGGEVAFGVEEHEGNAVYVFLRCRVA